MEDEVRLKKSTVKVTMPCGNCDGTGDDQYNTELVCAKCEGNKFVDVEVSLGDFARMLEAI